MKILVFTITLLLSQTLFAQSDKYTARSGNSDFKKGNYKSAEIKYKKALEKNPTSVKSTYNLGNAIFKDSRAEEAVKFVAPMLDTITSPITRSKGYHNIGNYNLSQKKYNEAVEAYKSSLRENPSDYETKSNLAYAQKMLKDQQDKQNENQNQDQNKPQDQKDKQDKKDQQKQQDKNDQQQDKKEQNQPQMNKQSAEQMLQAIQNKENQTQEKVKKEKAKALGNNKPDKNW